MRVRNVLRAHVATFFRDLSFLTNNFNSFAARAGARFQYIHMFITRGFSIDTELAIIIRKNICFRTKAVLIGTTLKHSCGSLNILPH
jgi:hypothetical protein